MKLKNWTIIALALAVTLAMSAQDIPQPKPKHHQYKLYDVGTFGGPNSYVSVQAISVTNAGAIGLADTSVSDPFYPYCFQDCFVGHAFLWRNGVATDLGALPGNNGGNSSYAFTINNSGLAAGISENGSLDPATGYPEVNAVVWKDGNIINLGTFGGTQSTAYMMNNRGQVVGNALNTIPDPYSFGSTFPGTTQSHAFVWEKGVMSDLGTLGGPDAVAIFISQSGAVAGTSYTSYNPNPDTGVPTVDPFVWRNGKMTDLGSLGGTLASTWGVNNRGQVTGYSYLAGNQLFHGFLWDGEMLKDLPPVTGGSISVGLWINEIGDVVGGSSIAGDQLFHAPLWTHGQAIDLGTVGQDACSQAYAINEAKQIVGVSGGNGVCSTFQQGRAFLWENGGPMVDLNALIENPSDLHVYWATYITEGGVIFAYGIFPDGDVHAAVLVPGGDCDDDCELHIAESLINPPAVPPATTGSTLPALGKPAIWGGQLFERPHTTPH
jgi:probable HAF family extracellular repeat protein